MQSTPQVIVRNDLINLKTNPAGYIADMVLPPLNVYAISGSRNAALANVTGSAQLNRSPSTSVTANIQQSNMISFTCQEIISRQVMDEGQRAMFGSDSEFESVLAFTGSKMVKDAIETKVATLTANAAAPQNIIGNIFGGLLTAVQFLSAYGRVQLSGSVAAWNTVRADTTVIDRMKATGVPLTTVQDVRSISASQLAAVLEADEVLEARTDTLIWQANRIFACVKVDSAADPMGTPQTGRRLIYAFIGADGTTQTMTCEQMWDTTLRNNVLDFVTYDVGKIYNTLFAKTLSLDGS